MRARCMPIHAAHACAQVPLPLLSPHGRHASEPPPQAEQEGPEEEEAIDLPKIVFCVSATLLMVILAGNASHSILLYVKRASEL